MLPNSNPLLPACFRSSEVLRHGEADSSRISPDYRTPRWGKTGREMKGCNPVQLPWQPLPQPPSSNSSPVFPRFLSFCFLAGRGWQGALVIMKLQDLLRRLRFLEIIYRQRCSCLFFKMLLNSLNCVSTSRPSLEVVWIRFMFHFWTQTFQRRAVDLLWPDVTPHMRHRCHLNVSWWATIFIGPSGLQMCLTALSGHKHGSSSNSSSDSERQ